MSAAPRRPNLRDDALARLPDLKARYPAVFQANLRRRAKTIAVAGVLAGLAIFALIDLDFSPVRILNGLGRLVQFTGMMLPPETGGRFWLYLEALGQTLAIAFLGTTTAALLAFPVAFLAARNVVRNPFVHFSVRRSFDVIRAVDALIWALIWINVVGLGPFAGALAIACADFGAFGKLFSEALEATDRRSIEGINSVGGTGLHQVRFGLVPQVLPVFASQVLYFI
ncbi:MAG: phosphonate ABC transporter, permease protein PhnE, partial [Methylobacteriaceae bacterium]|nr:phosphonate ABC transporter, permease protein PhnE [Methylobacteriaceae bacterium]